MGYQNPVFLYAGRIKNKYYKNIERNGKEELLFSYG
jgi:hypothetical protein